MRLQSYSIAGPVDPGTVILFPRLPVMTKLLGVSLTGTASAGCSPVVFLRDEANTLMAAFVADTLPAGAIEWLAHWSVNQPSTPGLVGMSLTGLDSSRGFIPPDFWLPPNWQLTVQLVDAVAPLTITRAQMTFLAPE